MAVTLAELPDDIMGEADIFTNEIKINNKLPQSQQEATLFHEVLHFLNWTLDSEPMGHIFIESLAEQLYQVLAENKLLSPMEY